MPDTPLFSRLSFSPLFAGGNFQGGVADGRFPVCVYVYRFVSVCVWMLSLCSAVIWTAVHFDGKIQTV